MGLLPTQRNENHKCGHPRDGGGPFFRPMDSRFRGNAGFATERDISTQSLCSKGGNDEGDHER